MKKPLITMLLLAAAPLLPLTAVAQEPTAAPVAAVIGADLPAAAYLPQDTEGFIAFGNLRRAAELWHQTSENISGAIGFGKGSAAAASALLPLAEALSSTADSAEWTEQWAELADELPQRIIGEQVTQQRAEGVERMITAVRNCRIAPIYGVLVNPEEEATAEMQEDILQEIKEVNNGAQPVAVGAWKGLKLNFDGVETEFPELSVMQQMQLREALAAQSVYILTQVRNHALIIVLCSDPQQAALPESAEQSVLATQVIDFLKPQAVAAAWLSPELLAAANAYGQSSQHIISGMASGIFKTLAEQSAPDRPVYQAAAQAVEVLAAQMDAMSPQDRTAATLLVTADERLHITMDSDAHGLRFEPTAHPVAPGQEEAVLTFSADRATGGTIHPDVAAIASACEQLADGFAATLVPEARYNAQTMMAQYRLFNEETAALGHALTAWCEALDGSFSLVADGKGQVPASLVGGNPAQMMAVPRVVISCGVRERAKLSEGLGQMQFAVSQSMRKMGADSSVLTGLPLATTTSGNAMLYTVSTPACNPDFSPCLAVTDSRLSLGSSAALCDSMVNAAAATAPQPGITLTLRLQPMQALMQAEAAALPDNEDLQEAAEACTAAASAVSEVTASVTASPDDRLHLNIDITPAP